MTDKELAKEYVDKLYAEKVSNEDYDKDGWILYRSEDIGDAFLAGLKAGKDTNVSTKWHDLRKNPNDLPKENMKQVIVKTSDGDKRMGWYSMYSNCWWSNDCPSPDEYIDDAIEWCEMP